MPFNPIRVYPRLYPISWQLGVYSKCSMSSKRVTRAGTRRLSSKVSSSGVGASSSSSSSSASSQAGSDAATSASSKGGRQLSITQMLSRQTEQLRHTEQLRRTEQLRHTEQLSRHTEQLSISENSGVTQQRPTRKSKGLEDSISNKKTRTTMDPSQ